LEALITHRIPAAEFQKGFDAIKAGVAGKVVMSWD
jgi:threonine 3-dehydrogenase